jgi:uncharacterized phage-associated protein
MKLTDDDLAAWRALPVSEFIKEATRRDIEDRIKHIKEAAWMGNPTSEDERLALHRLADLWRDYFFEADAQDFNGFMNPDAEIHE